MINAQPSPVMSPETKELTSPPSSGLASTLESDDFGLPPTVEQSISSMQPLDQFGSQLLAILSDIDATPSPVASLATQQSIDASPLTERAIRYHRRDAFRTDRNNPAPVPLPSSTEPSDTFRAETLETNRSAPTPAPQRRLFDSTIPNPVSPLNHEQYRSPSFTNLRGIHSVLNTPATFPRTTRVPHMTEQRSLSAGLRSLPRAPPPPPCSIASPPQNVFFVFHIVCPQDRPYGTSAFRSWNRFCPPGRTTRTPSGDFLPCGLVHTPGDIRLRH